MNEVELKQICKNAKTNLLFSDIEIINHYVFNNIEFLKVDFSFTTTGNIITFSHYYTKKEDVYKIISSSCYSVKDPETFNIVEIDKETIKNLFNFANSIDNIKIKKRTINNKRN